MESPFGFRRSSFSRGVYEDFLGPSSRVRFVLPWMLNNTKAELIEIYLYFPESSHKRGRVFVFVLCGLFVCVCLLKMK